MQIISPQHNSSQCDRLLSAAAAGWDKNAVQSSTTKNSGCYSTVAFTDCDGAPQASASELLLCPPVLLFSVSDTVRKLPTSSGDYRRKKTAVVVEKRRPVSSMVMSALIITTTAAADAAAVGDCGKSPRELVQLSSSSSLTAAGAR